MPTRPKCCSKRATKLKVANFQKAKAAADKAASGGGPKAPAKKAPSKKAPNKPAKPCTVCAKKAK